MMAIHGKYLPDADAEYAYISTEAEGYVGNILIIYDVGDPANPVEVSRWHMPGQHLAAVEDLQPVECSAHHHIIIQTVT